MLLRKVVAPPINKYVASYTVTTTFGFMLSVDVVLTFPNELRTDLKFKFDDSYQEFVVSVVILNDNFFRGVVLLKRQGAA